MDGCLCVSVYFVFIYVNILFSHYTENMISVRIGVLSDINTSISFLTAHDFKNIVHLILVWINGSHTLPESSEAIHMVEAIRWICANTSSIGYRFRTSKTT